MARPFTSPSDPPWDWPVAGTTPLDFAASPLGLGLATSMDELGSQNLPYHHHHQGGGYGWGAWYGGEHELDPLQGQGQLLVGAQSQCWSASGPIASLPVPAVTGGSHGCSPSNANIPPPILAQMYADLPFTSLAPGQQHPPYLRNSRDKDVQSATTPSPSADLDHSSPSMDKSSTRTLSISTGESNESSKGRKPRTQRERNRLAAHKCRQKSKLNAEDLQQKERELAEQHRCLSEHVQFLRNEVLNLKNEVLRHGTCDCELISEYIARAAQSLP